MFFYSYLFRSNKHFKYFLYCTSSSTLLHQYLRGIDIFAAKILSRSSSTKIQHIHKKEIAAPATSHRLTESARAKALRRARLCHLPPASPSSTPTYHTNYQHTIVIAGCPGPLVPIGETGKELIYRSRARCRLIFFHIYSQLNSNIFLFSSPKYRYHFLFSFSSHFSSIFSSSILTLPLTSFLSLPAKFARSADGER